MTQDGIMTRIHRMNFLKGGKRVITYRVMISFTVLAVMLMGLWYASTFGFIYYYKHKTEEIYTEVGELSKKKEKMLSYAQLAGARNQARTAKKEFAELFSNPSKVSVMLRELAKQMPKQLQLSQTLINKNPETGSHELFLSGTGRVARLVSNFVSRLEDSQMYQNVELLETKHGQKTGSSFTFKISATIVP